MTVWKLPAIVSLKTIASGAQLILYFAVDGAIISGKMTERNQPMTADFDHAEFDWLTTGFVNDSRGSSIHKSVMI